MRYAIISDIHGNLIALETVLKELRSRSVDAHICLGDIVGYGPWPNECCEAVRTLEPLAVVGNHDQAVLRPELEEWFNALARQAVRWTREQLSDDNLAYLDSLQERIQLEQVTIVHGSLRNPWEYITSAQEALQSFRELETPLGLIGHTHYAEWYVERPGQEWPEQYTATAGTRILLNGGLRYLVNPGSVGQPRDRDSRASCAVYDVDSQLIEIIRKPYNIAAVKDEMQQQGLPLALAERLDFGV